MRVFIVWIVSALVILFAIALGNTFGISKHIITVWVGAIYMIIISIKRYNDENYSEVIGKIITGAVVLFSLAIILTVIEVCMMLQ